MRNTPSNSIADLFNGESVDSNDVISIPASAKLSNNRGGATRVNRPYVPLSFRFLRGLPNTSLAVELSNREDAVVNSIRSDDTGALPDPFVDFVGDRKPELRAASVKHICFVCMRKFRNEAHLLRHEKKSYQHFERLQQPGG